MKIFNKLHLNQRGFSLVEILISLGILAGFAVVVIKSAGFINKQAADVKVESHSGEVVSTIANKVLGYASSFQVDFSDKNTEEIFQKAGLPMAWDLNGEDAPIDQCEGCKGRYGIVVKPLTDFNGLYKVTAILEHPSFKLDDNKEHRVKFERLIGN